MGKSAPTGIITGHVALIFPSNYVKAADLAGRDITIEIVRVEWEALMMQGGKKDTKPAVVMRTTGGRPMGKKWILNKTCANQIAAVTGEVEAKNWTGKRVTIYPTTCKGAEGGIVECIRVRPRTAGGNAEPPADMMRAPDVEGGEVGT